MFEGAAGAEGGGFAGEDEVEAVAGARGQIGFQHVGQVAGGEDDAGRAVFPQPVELPFEKGAAADGDEGLGQAGKMRGKARALAAEQDDGLRDHEISMPSGRAVVKRRMA